MPSSLSEPMRLPDVYGLCFALLYLIEIGDDIPWLYGACYGFMMEVCESLPWGMKEYDELDDPIWEYDNDEASVPKTAAIPDLNERKYAYKDSDGVTSNRHNKWLDKYGVMIYNRGRKTGEEEHGCLTKKLCR